MSRTFIKSESYVVCSRGDRVVGDWNFIVVCKQQDDFLGGAEKQRSIDLRGSYNEVDGDIHRLSGWYNRCTGKIFEQEGSHNQAGVEKVTPRSAPRPLSLRRMRPLLRTPPPPPHQIAPPPLTRTKKRGAATVDDSAPAAAAAAPRVKRRITFSDMPAASVPAAEDSAPAAEN